MDLTSARLSTNIEDRRAFDPTMTLSARMTQRPWGDVISDLISDLVYGTDRNRQQGDPVAPPPPLQQMMMQRRMEQP